MSTNMYKHTLVDGHLRGAMGGQTVVYLLYQF